MEPLKMAKQMIDFQKATFDNTFNAMVLLQEQTERMVGTFMEQATFLPEEGKKMMRDWVQTRIDSGRYASVSDYVRDLIRKDQAAADNHEQWLAGLDASIVRSLEDAAAGRALPAKAVFDRLGAKYAAMTSPLEQP